ncbi:T9SS type B sorting domain-containing protein [Flavobacterium litorale]|uniref:T9SS type B sorting domain-containing protein n=1 Tax=Flavobacterium litorale TaxID=2856519 RepID=A0ABX8V6R4_9FLAO|nr:T9SS type B sorting domain-containing protein [Flavobacterium litorale]QYJ68510.1 T9SS type B sorting domain-containing protein [Flavobacterium litorale]
MKSSLLFLFFMYIGFLNAKNPSISFLEKPESDSTFVFTSILLGQFTTNCDLEIILNNQESNLIYLYWAANAIRVGDNYRIASNSGSNIVMKAGKVIVLKPSTNILKGNHCLARIEPCIPSCKDNFIIDKVFTPNGDGINDYWNVHHIENISNIEIFIFDRYGKLITTVKPKSRGWDGTFNGYRLPATDYWYLFRYDDCYGNRLELKSHFSLVR